MLKIGRTVPPAAAPLGWTDLCGGVVGMVRPERSLRAFEEDIRRHFGVRHVFLLSSGTAALAVALTALKTLSSRTEVIIPAYTCFSVPAAVLKAGLRPVPCDIDRSTFDFDRARLEQAVGNNTLCVVAHHLFGIPSDVERTRALCRARGAFVVEDAAQAMGVESNGRALGTIGDAGIFSLGRGKNITCGSGGIIVTGSDAVAAAIARESDRLASPPAIAAVAACVKLALMAIFIRPWLYWIAAGLPLLRLGRTIFPTQVAIARLSGLQAGVLRHWKVRLAESNRIRSETAGDLARRLASRSTGALAPHPYLRLPVFARSIGDKARLFARAQAWALGLSPAYPTPVNEIAEIRAAFEGQRFPSARWVADRLVTLPTHHWVSEKDKQAIVACVGAATTLVRPIEAWTHAS
jgi:dTDP-4-amino-4,6-dideoxygalactose transaminase